MLRRREGQRLNRERLEEERKEDESYLDSLKVFKNAYLVDGQNECSICLGDFEEGQNIVKLECSGHETPHMFHYDCLIAWMDQG